MPRPDPAEGLSTTSIAMSTLKSQNLSLANRITALKREKADLSQHKNEFERKNLALETNAAVLKQYWVKHLNELKATRQLQKPFNDKKLEQEFEECLSLAMSVLDTLTFQQSQEEFQEKVAQMFTAEGKVYKDIITGSQRVIETAIERVTIEIEQCRLSTEEGVSNLTGFQQKLQELSDSVDQVRDSRTKIDQNNFLTQIAEMKKKAEKLEEDLADVKEYNEVLDRRFKIALRGFIQIDEETEKEQELGCICGGKIFDYLAVETIKATKEVEDDEYEKIEERKAGEGSAIIANKDIALLNQKIERFEKDIQELTDEKFAVLTQNEKLKQEKKNLEETFYNSKLFTSLVAQAQELLKFINLLKSKLSQYEKLMKDFEKARSLELEEVFKKIVEDKDKFLNMIKDISMSYDIQKRKFYQVESELVKEYDLAVKFSSFMEIMEQNDKKYSNLNQENDLLRTQLKEATQAQQASSAQVIDLNEKNTALTIQNQKLRTMIPGEIKLDEIAFRHSKHREFLNELHSLNKKHNLNIKEKVDDLKVYIKSREEKVEHMESKMKTLNNEIAQSKKQAEQLIKEVELNSRIAGDVDQKYQQLNSQIRSQNENFANLVKEKVSDRTQFEHEKSALQNHINELNGKIQALTDAKDAQEEYILVQKSAIEENKSIRESLLKKIEEQKVEIAIIKESQESLEQVNKDFIKDNENLKKSVKEKSGFISQKLQRLKKMSNDATITDEEETEFLKLENEKFKRMIICSVCGLKEKSVVLAKCFHTFCRPCITGTMEARNRRCPLCKTKIGLDDIKTIHWDV